MEFVASALLVLLGWLLGYMGGVLRDQQTTKKHLRFFKSSLRYELQEFQVRMALVYFRMHLRHKALSPEDYRYCASVVTKYEGPQQDQLGRESFSRCSKLDDTSIRQFLAQHKPKEGASFSFPKFVLPILDSGLDILSQLEETIARELILLLNDVIMLNESIEYHKKFFDRTFDQNLSFENVQTNQENLISREKKIGERAKIISQRVGRIVQGL